MYFWNSELTIKTKKIARNSDWERIEVWINAQKGIPKWIVSDYTDKLDNEGTRMLTLLLKRVKRMYSHIEGILLYSKVARIKEKEKQLNLNQLVKNVIKELKLPENIIISIENELPIFKGDKFLLEQIFRNLLSNAIKFMDKEKGFVKVDCLEKEDFWE